MRRKGRRPVKSKHPVLGDICAMMIVLAIVVMLFMPTVLRVIAAMNPPPPECFGLS